MQRAWSAALERFTENRVIWQSRHANYMARPDRPLAEGGQRDADRGASFRGVRRGSNGGCCVQRPTTDCRNARSPNHGVRRITFRRARRWTRCSARVTELRRQIRLLQRQNAARAGDTRHAWFTRQTRAVAPKRRPSHSCLREPYGRRQEIDRRTGARRIQRLQPEDRPRAADAATASRTRTWRSRPRDKEVVFREDKTTLYRYKPTAKRTLAVPVLVAYGQIGRYTMTDLQEDRSMLRNLLALGVDVYAVDWGSPDPQRSLAHVRGLRRRLPERLHRVHLPRARPAGDQPARHLRRRRLLAVLRRALPGARQEPDPDHHAGRLPSGSGRRPH